MAKPSKEITKTEFNKNYNVIKVLTTKSDIMAFIKTQYQESNNNAMVFATRKTHKVTLEDVILRLDKIDKRLDKIEDRLDRNNIN